jgi:hypothetical protein
MAMPSEQEIATVFGILDAPALISNASRARISRVVADLRDHSLLLEGDKTGLVSVLCAAGKQLAQGDQGLEQHVAHGIAGPHEVLVHCERCKKVVWE